MGQLTPFGKITKWLLIPVALGASGFFLVGPRLGSSAKAANAIRNLPPSVRNAIPIPAVHSNASEEEAQAPNVKVSVRPIGTHGPQVSTSSEPLNPPAPDPDAPEVEPAPRKKAKKKKPIKPKPATAQSESETPDPASSPGDAGADPASGSGDPASGGGTIPPPLLQ